MTNNHEYVRMLQKFPDTHYWLDSPDKEWLHFLIFFLTFLHMHFAMWWNHLFHFSVRVGLGWSSTALMNTQRASSTLSNRVPFSCFFTSGNRKKSQGERSGEYNWCGSSCISLSSRKSTVVVAVCTLSLLHWRKRPQTPVFGWCWHQTSKTFRRRWCVYQSAVTVRLFSRGMVVTWPDFPKKRAIIFLCVLGDLLSFGGRDLSAKPLIASWLPDHIDRSKLQHLSAFPRSFLIGLRWIFATWTCTTQP